MGRGEGVVDVRKGVGGKGGGVRGRSEVVVGEGVP